MFDRKMIKFALIAQARCFSVILQGRRMRAQSPILLAWRGDSRLCGTAAYLFDILW
jgi:hypothetical protein